MRAATSYLYMDRLTSDTTLECAVGPRFSVDTILACNKTPGTQLAIATSPDIKFDLPLTERSGSLPLAAPGASSLAQIKP